VRASEEVTARTATAEQAVALRLPQAPIGRYVLFEESDMRAWIKAHGIPAEPAAGRRKDADRGTGW
jgi:hypothetical protein